MAKLSNCIFGAVLQCPVERYIPAWVSTNCVWSTRVLGEDVYSVYSVYRSLVSVFLPKLLSAHPYIKVNAKCKIRLNS